MRRFVEGWPPAGLVLPGGPNRSRYNEDQVNGLSLEYLSQSLSRHAAIIAFISHLFDPHCDA